MFPSLQRKGIHGIPFAQITFPTMKSTLSIGQLLLESHLRLAGTVKDSATSWMHNEGEMPV